MVFDVCLLCSCVMNVWNTILCVLCVIEVCCECVGVGVVCLCGCV